MASKSARAQTISLGLRQAPAHQPLLQALAKEAEAMEKQRRIRLLADGLMRAAGILPHGKDLVVWLGGPSDRNNSAATFHWITQELAAGCLDPRSVHPESLLRALNKKVESLQEIN